MTRRKSTPRRFDRDRLHSFIHFLWQRFIDDKCFETAGALSYTTLVSVVPLLVASLAIFAAFPAFSVERDKLIQFGFHTFVPAAGGRIQDYLQGFADNASKLTGISVLVMFFSALSMMVSIEDRMNRIWRVEQARGWVSRVLLYWAALTLGPVLVVGIIAVSSYASAMPLVSTAADQFALHERLIGKLPFLITLGTLYLMYMLVPNRKVNWKHALFGALMGAVLFELARWGFTRFIHHAQTYQQVYGAALAAIPIFLLWIYLSWVIVILCASVAAAISAFDYLSPDANLPEEAQFLGLLAVLGHFIEAQRQGQAVDLTELRSRERFLHHAATQRYVDDLQRAGLLSLDDNGGWRLSRSVDSTDLLHIYAHSAYRLPLQPTGLAESLDIRLPEPLLARLENMAQSLAGTLGDPLNQVYPPAGPASSSSEVVDP